MQSLSHPAPCTQPYVTLLSKSNGRQTVYRPVIIDARGSRPFPAIVRHSTPRNVLSVAMSYANAKGLAFRLELAELAAEAASVQAELAEHGIAVQIETPAQPTPSDRGPTWSAGYEAGRAGDRRSAPAGLTTAQEREWYDGFDTGAATTRRHGRLKCVVINTSEGQYDLALFPWEDPNQVVAEAEAVMDEKDAKPWLGEPLNDDELFDMLFGPLDARRER